MPTLSQPTEITLRLPRPHPAQCKVIAEARRFNVIVCGRRWGKTVVCIDREIQTALHGFPAGWFAPTFKILEEAFRDFVKLLEPVIRRKSSNERIELITGGSIEFWSMDSGTIVARSRKYKRIVVDEASRVRDLKRRWEEEIRPTLTDLSGDAWFPSTPAGFDDYKDLFERQLIDSDWKSWQMPTWTNPYIKPEEIEKARKDLPEPTYMQEYGAEFIDALETFVPSRWVDACAVPGLPPMPDRQPIMVGVDAASKSDTFAVVGVYRDRTDPQPVFKPAFLEIFPPPLLDFREPEALIRKLIKSYYIIAVVYDPYQLVDLCGRLAYEQIALFDEFNQGQRRLLADRHFYGLIRDRLFQYDLQAHAALAQHIKNANAKLVEDKMRMVKRSDELKIDAAVATSMACYAATEWNI